MRLVQAWGMRMGGGRQQAAQRRWHGSNQHCASIAKLQHHARVQHIEHVQLERADVGGGGGEGGQQAAAAAAAAATASAAGARRREGAWPWCAGLACADRLCLRRFFFRKRAGRLHGLGFRYYFSVERTRGCGCRREAQGGIDFNAYVCTIASPTRQHTLHTAPSCPCEWHAPAPNQIFDLCRAAAAAVTVKVAAQSTLSSRASTILVTTSTSGRCQRPMRQLAARYASARGCATRTRSCTQPISAGSSDGARNGRVAPTPAR